MDFSINNDSCQIVLGNQQIYKVDSAKRMIYIYKYFMCPADFAVQGVINEDPSVWPDGARPANTCIPPSLPGNAPAWPRIIPNPQSTFATI